MKLKLFSICLGCLWLIGYFPQASFAQEKTDNISRPSQNYKGAAVSVLAVDKIKEYKDVFGQKLTAKPGYDIVIVKLKFIMATDTLKFENCRLNDNIESTYKWISLMSSPGSEETSDILFGVAEGTAIKTFHLDTLIYDLSDFGVK